jgi:hypothetical protein
MGMDLTCIIENKLLEQEILNIQTIVDCWTDIHKHVFEYRKKAYHNYGQTNLKSNWEYDKLDLESLHRIWEFEESRGEKRINILIGTNRLSTFYCDIRFNRKTIMICPSPEHKYANLHEPEIAEYIIKMVRMVASKFEQEEIIYCVDSQYPPGLIFSESIAGSTFENLKQIAINELGEPKANISDGMKDLFFIDNLKSQMPKLNKWNWMEFKYAAE